MAEATQSSTMKATASILFFLMLTVSIVPALSFFILDEVNTHNQSFEFSSRHYEISRTKKHKLHLLLPLVLTALLIKSIIFPLIVKAMAVMSSIAVLLSFMSLIISSIVGYAKLAAQPGTAPNVKVVYVDKKPPDEKVWSPPEEYIVPSIFRTKFSYVPRGNNLKSVGDMEVIDHYHTFVDK